MPRTDAIDPVPHDMHRAGLSRRTLLAIILAIVTLGFVLVAYGYWPGVMIDDARWQYQQVVDNTYEDWHPPLMAWTWRRLTAIGPGPGPMLLLQLALYWGGIASIALWAYRRGRERLGAVIACVGFIPAPLALGGTVVKDVLMAGLLTSAAGMSLWRDNVRGGAARTALTIGGVVLLLLAAAIRFNAFLACLPLLLPLMPPSLTRTKPRLIATALCGCLAFLAAGPMFAAFVDADKTNPEQSLVIFDLGGITEHSGINQFPDPGVADPVAVNHRCYDAFEWDSYSDWAKRPCPLGFTHFQTIADNEELDPRLLWLRAIAAHPIAYTEHRLAHFNQSIWLIVPSGPRSTAWTASVDNPWKFEVRRNRVLEAVDALANAAAITPLGWPVFWLCVALAALIVGRSAKVRGAELAVAASAFLYGLGYLVIGVATGMRYYVWTITGAGLGCALILGNILGRRSFPAPRAAYLASAIVIIPTLLAIAARLI